MRHDSTPSGGCRTLEVLRLWLILLLFDRWWLVCGVVGIFPVSELLEELKERRYDLPKRQMFINFLGRSLGAANSQTLESRCFRGVVSHGQSVRVVHYGVGSSHLGQWELADNRLHSPTPPGCMFRALSEIHARVFWISEWIDTFVNASPKQQPHTTTPRTRTTTTKNNNTTTQQHNNTTHNNTNNTTAPNNNTTAT